MASRTTSSPQCSRGDHPPTGPVGPHGALPRTPPGARNPVAWLQLANRPARLFPRRSSSMPIAPETEARSRDYVRHFTTSNRTWGPLRLVVTTHGPHNCASLSAGRCSKPARVDRSLATHASRGFTTLRILSMKVDRETMAVGLRGHEVESRGDPSRRLWLRS